MANIKPQADILANPEAAPKNLILAMNKLVKVWDEQTAKFKAKTAQGDKEEARQTLLALEVAVTAMAHCQVFDSLAKLLIPSHPKEVRMKAVYAISKLCNQVSNTHGARTSYFQRQLAIGKTRFKMPNSTSDYSGLSLLYLLMGKDQKIEPSHRANAALALWNIAHNNPLVKRETLLWTDFLQKLIVFFGNDTDKATRINVMGLARDLIYATADSANRFCEHGGVTKCWEILSAQGRKADPPVIQYMTCAVLKAVLSINDAHLEKRRGPLIEAGAPLIIFAKCKTLHAKCKKNVEFQNLLAAYLSFLTLVSRNKIDVQKQLVEEGAAEFIKDLLDPKLRNQEIRTQSSAFISSFYGSKCDFLQRFGQIGGLIKLVNVMSQEQNLMGMYSTFCAVVNLASVPANFELIETEANKIETVLNIIVRVCMNISQGKLIHLPKAIVRVFVMAVYYILQKSAPGSQLRTVFANAKVPALLKYLGTQIPLTAWGQQRRDQTQLILVKQLAAQCLRNVLQVNVEPQMAPH